jgi:hypothetical protein
MALLIYVLLVPIRRSALHSTYHELRGRESFLRLYGEPIGQILESLRHAHGEVWFLRAEQRGLEFFFAPSLFLPMGCVFREVTKGQVKDRTALVTCKVARCLELHKLQVDQ